MIQAQIETQIEAYRRALALLERLQLLEAERTDLLGRLAQIEASAAALRGEIAGAQVPAPSAPETPAAPAHRSSRSAKRARQTTPSPGSGHHQILALLQSRGTLTGVELARLQGITVKLALTRLQSVKHCYPHLIRQERRGVYAASVTPPTTATAPTTTAPGATTPATATAPLRDRVLHLVLTEGPLSPSELDRRFDELGVLAEAKTLAREGLIAHQPSGHFAAPSDDPEDAQEADVRRRVLNVLGDWGWMSAGELADEAEVESLGEVRRLAKALRLNSRMEHGELLYGLPAGGRNGDGA